MAINFGRFGTLLQLWLGEENPDSEPGFIYKHMNNGSGICPKCAPWLHMRTTGDGSDGVPVPGLHPNCKCYLMPVDISVLDRRLIDATGDKDKVLWLDHLEWLKSLPGMRLAAIVGPVRAWLVRNNKLSIDMLFDGPRLVSLQRLGFNLSGDPLPKNPVVELLFSDALAVEALTAFHVQHYSELPAYLQIGKPGNLESVRLMVSAGVIPIDQDHSGSPWLLLLVALIEALLGDD